MKAALASAICAACVAAPGAASAQGFAPAKGSVWMKLGYIHGQAGDQYAGVDAQSWRAEDGNAPRFDAALGERVGFISRQGQLVGGQLVSHDVTLDAVWSPIDGVTTGLFVPMLRYIQYSNDTNGYTTRALGPGDVKAYVGYQLTPRDQDVLGISLFGRVKIPTSFKFPYTNEALRGEGQTDVELGLENSAKIGPLLANLGATYRFRTDVVDGPDRVELGDELEVTASIGGAPLPWLWLSGGYSGLFGQQWEIETERYNAPFDRVVKREFQSVFAGAYVSFGQWIGAPGLALDLWYKLPIAGQDFSVMYSGGAGLAYGF